MQCQRAEVAIVQRPAGFPGMTFGRYSPMPGGQSRGTPYLRRMALLTAFAIGGAVAAVTVGALRVAFPGGRGQLDKDVALMTDALRPELAELAPITDDELERVSWNILSDKKRQGFTPGRITTIYHEGVVLFGFKKYWTPGSSRSLLYARSANYEWVYRIRGKQVDVAINGKPTGRLLPDGRLVDSKKRTLARLNRRTEQELWPVVVADAELGALTNPAFKHSELARAFSFTVPMSRTQRGYFLAVTLYEMLVAR